MPRYQLAIEERFAVRITTWVELDAASPEAARQTVLAAAQYLAPGDLTWLADQPELQIAHCTAKECDRDEVYEGREVGEITEIPLEVPDPRQGVLF